eukprot:6194469-Pleurochrysis_carterae.AAC.3
MELRASAPYLLPLCVPLPNEDDRLWTAENARRKIKDETLMSAVRIRRLKGRHQAYITAKTSRFRNLE